MQLHILVSHSQEHNMGHSAQWCDAPLLVARSRVRTWLLAATIFFQFLVLFLVSSSSPITGSTFTNPRQVFTSVLWVLALRAWHIQCPSHEWDSIVSSFPGIASASPTSNSLLARGFCCHFYCDSLFSNNTNVTSNFCLPANIRHPPLSIPGNELKFTFTMEPFQANPFHINARSALLLTSKIESAKEKIKTLYTLLNRKLMHSYLQKNHQLQQLSGATRRF